MRRTVNGFSVALLLVLLVLVNRSSLLAAPIDEAIKLDAQFRSQDAAGKYDEALETAGRMRKLAEGPLRNDHSVMIVAVTNQGLAQMGRGKLDSAEALLKWALDRSERTQGQSAGLTGDVANNLARLYEIKAEFAAAERLYKRSLAIGEKVHGPNDSSVATTISNLGVLYLRQGKYAEAEPLLKRGLEIKKKVHGLEHPHVAIFLNNLANLYDNQAKYAEAEHLYEQSLQIQEKLNGPEHPEVAEVLGNLGLLYDEQSKFAKAEPLCRRSLAIFEKRYGADHARVANPLNNLALICEHQTNYAEAEPLYQRALAINERVYGPDHPTVAINLDNIATLYSHQGKYRDAEPYFKRSLEIREKAYGPEHHDVALALNNLALLYKEQGKYASAERLLKRSLEIREKVHGTEHPEVATVLNNLASLYDRQAKYADAETFYNRALAIREKLNGPEHPDVARVLSNLALLYDHQARYAEAERICKKSLAIREAWYGPDHPEVATNLNNLALIYNHQAKYAEVEALYKRALEIDEKVFGLEHPDVAIRLNNLAALYVDQGKFALAEPLYHRSLAIREKVYGADHPDVARGLNHVARLYEEQGKYAEAELLYNRALVIREKFFDPDHPQVAISLSNLANLYDDQGRYAEAESLHTRALAIREKAFGPDHPAVALTLNNLAALYAHEGKYNEAEAFYNRALAIREKVNGPEHPEVATLLSNLAHLYRKQGEYTKAESLYKRSLSMRENLRGPDHPGVALVLNNLAFLYVRQDKYAEAEPLVDRAIAIRDRARVAPGDRYTSYELRAEIAWKQGRKREAVADLGQAMQLAEQQRVQSSGAGRDRAKAFAEYASAFELMVDWQTQLQDMTAALSAIERGHARSLLDELSMAGSDLHVGRSVVERENLQRTEAQLKQTVAELEKRLANLSDTHDEEQRSKLETELATARERLYEHYHQERTSSPVYRNLLSVGAGPPRLSQLRRELVRDDGLLLVYLLGEEGGYLLSVAPDQGRLVKLEFDEQTAEVLGVDPGPLTAKRLATALLSGNDDGLIQSLSDPKKAERKQTTDRLAALWTALMPAEERKLVTGGKLKRLLVVPDGPLALLPFETLVVERAADPKYLLDVGPAIQYAPSATVLYNLHARRNADDKTGLSVLSMGNATYGDQPDPSAEDDGFLVAIRPPSRYSRSGHHLSQLPYSGAESNWVVEALKGTGRDCQQLLGPQATEAQLRATIEGRQIVHLACHGLVDQQFGNFFGALAMTPGQGKTYDSADDGFLTLPEIYELNLKACELAILSACETNYGPQQKGEGVWALSRGFLVAGSRRVVASNWLVDDEAAASLISRFCGHLAQAAKEGHSVDHATTLNAAKRWVRNQEKWKSPYYWGTFVLVGPS